MDFHGILEKVFLFAFWGGLIFTVAMAALSGAFHHEFGSGSSFEGGHAPDLGGTDVETGHFDSGHAHVGWSDTNFPGASPFSPTVLCAALTGFGGIGYLALQRWDLGNGGAIGLALVASLGLGAVTFFAMDWLFRNVQVSSHVTAAALIGTKVPVFTTIEAGQAGAITIEAQGSRMTAPARAIDASRIPAGAEVEIRRVDGGVYVVEETRESWTARSKSKPDLERWN